MAFANTSWFFFGGGGFVFKRNDGIKSIHLSDEKLSNHFVILVGTQCALIQFGTCCKWAAPGMCMLPWLVNLQEKKIVSRKKCYGDVKEI